MKKAQRTITDVVREMMTYLPESEETISHGFPHYRVRDKTFAIYVINHHGDGRVALHVDAPRGAQRTFTRLDPNVYFEPPYVGSKGWLGIELDNGLPWQTVFDHVADAYRQRAPAALVGALPETVRIKPPSRKFRPEEIDPLKGKQPQRILKKLEGICLALPETTAGTAFGSPVWKAGKKTFVTAGFYDGSLLLSFWVGPERQKFLCKDQRFRVAPYTGHAGWIELNVQERQDWDEIRGLASESYRHFALKRMLKQLDGWK